MLLVWMGSQGVEELFFEVGILHMFLIKGCRDRCDGVRR
jgi:hypothetical protein